MNMNENIIEVKGLSKSFGNVDAVMGIDIIIKKGEMFGLVGPDGAGKTTVIRLLCGIVDADEGDGRIFGYDFKSEKGKIKNHIGYLSQKFSLYGDLTVDENIEFFAEINGIRDYKKRRDELLEFTRLIPFRKRLAANLSGGMKQKLALACTLIHTPDIIFLDEPTTGVDPVSRRDFWKILFSLLSRGITIVMTTPYLDEAERCTRLGMMHEGKFIATGGLQDIKKLMKGVVVEIVCDMIREAYGLLKQNASVMETQTFGDRLNIVIENENGLQPVKAALESRGIKVTDMRIIEPSLENIFISMVKGSSKNYLKT
jgi:ABC-2 type transport system ATP-binding protein